MQLNPYLVFNGNAEEALELYRDAIGGDVEILRVAGSPAAEHFPSDWGNKVLHGLLRSPAGTVMVSDATGENAGNPADNVSIAIHVESESQADAVFAKLVDGGKVTMPLEKTFWSSKFGMLIDKFGTKWMVNCTA